MQAVGRFPFGEPIRRIAQVDRRPKRVFILGVYASAVHARWIAPDNTQVVRALGVASEPYIFWRGEDADQIVADIDVPTAAGRLEPAGRNLNGPSGRSLDEHYLEPLGIARDEAWLCDLVPHSCMNAGQERAVKERYEPAASRLRLPAASWPTVPRALADDRRREEVSAELRKSRAETILTLGDQPLNWFGRHVLGTHAFLAEYEQSSYGVLHDVEFEGRGLNLLPLVHPRQAARLGSHSPRWAELHGEWAGGLAPRLLG